MAGKMMLLRYVIVLGLLLSFSYDNRVEGKLNVVKALANMAEAIGNLIQLTDDCKYTCPNGATPKVNPKHKKTADGCGSYGTHFKVGAVPGATECCNKHDFCYDTCNSDKAVCDRQLEECLQNICYKLEGKITDTKEEECKTVVQYIFGGVSTLGCEAYLKSQKSACICQ